MGNNSTEREQNNSFVKKLSTVYPFRILEIIFGAFIVISLAFIISDMEMKFFPVIEDFQVTSVKADDNGIELSGTFDKTRDCQCLSMTAYIYDGINTIPRLVPIKLDDVGLGSNRFRAAIPQAWGPWYIQSGDVRGKDEVSIELYITHKCHNMYNSTQKLKTINIIPYI